MQDKLRLLSVKIQNVINREEGQDLIEYALVCALIALAATATMKSVGTSINGIFSDINASL
jgi:pilus assembly protein Flp/PilA